MINCRFLVLGLFFLSFAVHGQYSISYSGSYNPEYGSNSIDPSLNENQISAPIAIGFPFYFYGQSYDSLRMSDNGFITFSNNANAGCCDGQYLPNPNEPNNLIALAWLNLSASNGYFQYELFGVAPNRRFVITYSASDDCDYYYLDGQIKLFEGSYDIEFHTDLYADYYYNYYPCTYVTQGIENIDGTSALTTPGRNFGDWQTYSDYVKYECISCGPDDDMAMTSTNTLFCAGNQNLSISATNAGGNTVDSFMVGWTWNGVAQASVNANEFSLSPSSSRNVDLGTKNLVFGNEYVLKTWTFNPNGVTDPNPINDTITQTIYVGYQGIYTVGGVSPDFSTLQDAVNAIDSVGICDTVYFNIRSGTYMGNVSLDYINGTFNAPIIIQSETGNKEDVHFEFTSSSSSDNYIIDLNYASNFHFAHLSFNNLGTIYAQNINCLYAASNISFTDCQFENNVPLNTNARLVNISGSRENFRFENNIFEGGLNGIYVSSPSSFRHNNFQILNNTFNSQGQSAISLFRIDEVEILNNEISNTTTSGTNVINLNDIEQGARVSTNKITWNSSSGNAIYLLNSNNSGDTAIVSNNEIIINASSSAFGLCISVSSNIDVFFNSIYVNGVEGVICYGVNCTNSSIANFKNNNVYVTPMGYAVNRLSGTFNSDYNNLFSDGPYVIRSYTTDYSTLGEWQAALNLDSHSVSVDPYFLNDTVLIPQRGQLNMAGMDIAGISADLNNVLRSSPPDIGAYEFTPAAKDFALLTLPFEELVPDGSFDVKIIIENNGDNPITSADLDWMVNGGAQPQVNWTGNLASGELDTLTLGSVMLEVGISYAMQSFITSSNGTAELITFNDSLVLDTIMPALAGEYTIGGSSPDFVDILAAIDAMEGGILDTTTFIIRTGQYSGAHVLHAVKGKTCEKLIYFKSSTGNPADVIIDNNNINDFTLILNDADGYIFENLTFQSLITNKGQVVTIQQGSDCNTFENCRFIGINAATTSPNNAVVYSQSDSDNNNAFNQCKFIEGSYGLFLYGGNSSNREINTRITNNTFQDNYYMGCYLVNQIGVVFDHNLITNSSANATSYYGTYVYNCYDSTKFTNNIYDIDANNDHTYMAYFYNLNSVGTNSGLIANNYVNSSRARYGFYFSNTYNQRIEHNTINLDRVTTSSSAALLLNLGGQSNEIFSNILINKIGTGPALFIQYPTQINSANYNCLLDDGSFGLVQYNSTIYSDLTSWQATGHGTNTISEDPQFVSNSYLPSSAFVEDSGRPNPKSTTDILDAPRSTTQPDMGCVEFSLSSDDIAITEIKYPKEPFNTGIQPIIVRMFNNGADTLRNAEIYIQVNDSLLPTYYFTGLLAASEGYDSLDVTFYDFQPFTSYQIKVWGSNPNGQMDGNAANDTISFGPIFPALGGIYTIGGVDPDFNTFNEAIMTLDSGGIASNVIFKIRPGVYSEPLHIRDFPGSSCQNTVVFESENGDQHSVTINNLGIDAHVLTLTDVDGLHFKNLTIETLNNSYPHCIDVYGHSDCNVIDHCIIRGISSTNASGNNAAIVLNSGPADHNIFIDNTIRYGSYVFYILGTNSETKTIIKNNHIIDPFSRGIFIYRKRSAQIIGNRIESFQNFSTGFYGIYAQECNDSFYIENNTIQAGAYCGIYVSAGARLAPMRARINNNMVSVGGSSSTWAIYLTGVKETDIFYNSLHNYSTYTNSINNDAFFSTSTLAGNSIKNNVFVNSSGAGQAINITGTLSDCDYNDLYTLSGTLGSWAGSTTNTLLDWQTASGLDAYSISLDPLFIANNDLHVRQSSLNGAAITIPYITTDVDGDIRDIDAPDIGADEFIPSSNNNASIIALASQHAPFAAGVQDIVVELKNDGGNLLNTANIRWLVNGVEQPTYSWSGSLSSGADTIVTLGSYDIQALNEHSIIAWSEMPNGVTDTININDTINVTQIYPALNGIYTLGGVLPDFANFNKLQLNICFGGLLGDIHVAIRDGLYTDAIVLNNIPRVSGDESIHMYSESHSAEDVILKPNLSNGQNAIKIIGEDHISFTSIKIEGIAGHLIFLEGGANHILLDSCIVQGRIGSYSPYSLIYSTSTRDDSLRITNCHLIGGQYGALLSSSSGNREKGLIIHNNIIERFWTTGIAINSQSDFTITGNTIIHTDFNPSYAISSTSSAGFGNISQNILKGSTLRSGIYLLDAYHTSSDKLLISNNHMTLSASNALYGIFLDRNVANSQFFHNTIHFSNPLASATNFRLSSYGCSNLEIENNIFSNLGAGHFVDFEYTNAVSSFDYNNFFGDLCDYVLVSTVDATLAAFRVTSSTNINSLELDPLYLTHDNYQIRQVGLNNVSNPIAAVITDIEGNIRSVTQPDLGALEFTPTMNDIGITQIVNPTTFCGLSAAENITIRIQNFGSNTQSNFDVFYSFNDQVWISQNVGSVMLEGGQYIDFTFNNTEDLSVLGPYSFDAHCTLMNDANLNNDTLLDHVVVHLPVLTDVPTMLIPLHNEVHVDLPLNLSWNPVTGADRYDVYIWPFGGTMPAQAEFENVSHINVVYPGANYGNTYQWKVIAKNVCNQFTTSGEQIFTVRELPDLRVDSIIYPTTANSGQQIEIEWIVKNSGLGNTGAELWSDAIYLSSDATLNLYYDDFLGAVPNLNALMPGESYQQTANFTIPQGLTGEYYIFAYSDRFNDIIESDNGNNTFRTIGKIQITLTPPPDLVIEEIITPSTVFAGNSFPFQYTIKNNGTGNVNLTAWRDEWKLSQSPNNPGGGTWNKIDHQKVLLVDSTYTVMSNIFVPISQDGPHFVHIRVDKNNNIFEFAGENNNDGVSDTIAVLPQPPPDIIVDTLHISDTVSPNEMINYDWYISNIGGSSTLVNYWINRLHISTAPIFNSNFNVTVDDIYQYGPFAPGEHDTISATGKIPIISDGQHYFFAEVDLTNAVIELSGEANNIKRVKSVWVQHPDLSGSPLSTTDTVLSGNQLLTSWSFVNLGPGDLIDRSVKYTYYISADASWNSVNATLLKSTQNSLSLRLHDTLINDSLLINESLTIPDGWSGNYYIYVHINHGNSVEEHQANYSNNIIRSSVPFYIKRANYPDLIPQNITVPDTGISGLPISINYQIKNQGLGTANGRGKESIYISFNPVWNQTDAVLIYSSSNATPLQSGSSISINRSVLVPSSLSSNVYYIYVRSDVDNEHYEYLGEQNNIQRSTGIFIKPYPSLDLELTEVSLNTGIDTLSSPGLYSTTYAVKNNSLSSPLFTNETDVYYLTADSVFNISMAITLGTALHNRQSLGPAATNYYTGTIQVPNGIQGTYYLWVEIDQTDKNKDTDRSNNLQLIRDPFGQAKRYFVKRQPSPDLIFTQVTWPASVISGRKYQLHYIVKNSGEGTASNTREQFYISTDNKINGGDIKICDHMQVTLLPDSSYGLTCDYIIPSSLQGNYYLIAQTDYLDNNYEWMSEDNNQVLRIFEVIKPPPADLIVEDIIVPLSVQAGKLASISWGVKNNGSNPANGNIREIVYLSYDSLLDVSDQVFGFIDSFAYIPPASVQSRNLTAPINGVADADYYAIVRTDALDQIIETNDTNNISHSLDLMSIDIKVLPLDSIVTDTLLDDQELYYKLVIDPSLEDETILVELNGDSLNAANELYIRFNQIATRAEYDKSSLIPGNHYQRIILSNVQIGTYYITSFGNSLSHSNQTVNLFARVMHREILAIQPDKGAQGEFVTMLIHGSKLAGALSVRLRAQDSTALVKYADTFTVISDEYIAARFNLDSLPLGLYNVDCIYDVSEPIAVYEPGFQVFIGQAAEIVANWELTPGSVSQFNRPIKLRVNIINNGDGDATNQNMLLYSPAGNILAKSLEELRDGVHFDEITIPLGNHPQFGNVLAPGESRQVEFYSYSRPYPLFVIQMP